MGGEFFTDFKSSNGIEISWLVQALSNFYWFWGSIPLGGGRWVHGGGGGYGGVEGCPMHTHMHTHTHACTHARTCMLNMLIMLNMYTCVYVRVCVCVCVCMCGGHPPMPPDAPDTPPPTCPLPRAAGSPKQQNSISPELIEIIWFCLKILYLWTFLNSYRL